MASGKGLYLPSGAFREFAELRADRAALAADLATRETAGESWLASLGLLPDPDPVLRKRGDDAQVLADLTADDQVCSAIQGRKIKTLNKRDFRFLQRILRAHRRWNRSAGLAQNAASAHVSILNVRGSLPVEVQRGLPIEGDHLGAFAGEHRVLDGTDPHSLRNFELLLFREIWVLLAHHLQSTFRRLTDEVFQQHDCAVA